MIFGHSEKERKLQEELKTLGEELKGSKRGTEREDKNLGSQDQDKRWLHREPKWDIKKKRFLGKINMLGGTRR